MAINTVISIKLTDGNAVDATLNFARLRKLSVKHKELYKHYQKLVSGQAVDEIGIAEIIYVAYVCANLDSDIMDIEDFMELLTPNREELMDIYANQLQPRVNSKN